MNGWDPLIQLARNYIQDDSKILQIKEKFGGLRIYTGEVSIETLEFIDLLEKLSFNICQECGAPAETRWDDSGWIRTLCDDCRADYKTLLQSKKV